MAGTTTSDRDRFLAFELALDEKVSDEVRQERWGRLFLVSSLPLIWDANWVAIEQEGLGVDEVVAIADEVLGGEGFAHRTVCALGEADGRRLDEAIEAEPGRWPGWEVERTLYMVWCGGEVTDATLPAGRRPEARSHLSTTIGDDCERTGGPAARETTLAEVEGLRRAILAENTPAGSGDFEATVDQLLELDRRYAERCEDRWFVAPADAEPASACRLYQQGGIAQVEDVGTLRESRERGYAKAIVLAAVAAAEAAGDATIFLTADATDWPQLMYAKLDFETVGDLTILRRRP